MFFEEGSSSSDDDDSELTTSDDWDDNSTDDDDELGSFLSDDPSEGVDMLLEGTHNCPAGKKEGNSSDESSPEDPAKDGRTVKFKHKLKKVLDEITVQGCDYAVSGELTDAPVMVIEIKGVGEIVFPVYEDLAKIVLEKFDQSPFGLREQTIVDTSVRNSKQLSPDSFKIINSNWEAYLEHNILKTVAEEMCIKTDFKASLYKLFLYEPGSFFKPHCDTEKEEGMFATLVIQLPSKYTGGELIVNYENQTKTFDFSCSGYHEGNREFKTFFTAFYCDLEHEVLPITEGYRFCLIYNLVTAKTNIVPTVPHFDKVRTRFLDSVTCWPDKKPVKIVYVLSHKYTESGLSFENLKGVDRVLAGFLKSCTESFPLVLYLGLFSKSIFGPVYGDRDYFEFERSPGKEYCLKDLIPCTSKTYKCERLNVCFSDEVIPSDCFKGAEPDKVDFDGYMGNEGASVSKWYRRAAFVFWPVDCSLDVLRKSYVDPKILTEIYLRMFKEFSANPSNVQEKQQVIKWISTLLDSENVSFSDVTQCQQVLTSIVAFNNLALLLKFLKKGKCLYSDCIPFLVTECEKHGWNILGPSIVELFKLESNLSEGIRKLTLFMPEEYVTDQDKVGFLRQCLTTLIKLDDRFSSFINLANNWLLNLLKQDTVENVYDMFISANKLSYDLSKYIEKKSVVKVLVPVLLKLAEVPGLKSYSCWINTATYCIKSLHNLIFESVTAPDWTRKGITDCKCASCRKVSKFLKTNKQEEMYTFRRERKVHIQGKLMLMKNVHYKMVKRNAVQEMIVTKEDRVYDEKISEQNEALVLLPKIEAVFEFGTASSDLSV